MTSRRDSFTREGLPARGFVRFRRPGLVVAAFVLTVSAQCGQSDQQAHSPLPPCEPAEEQAAIIAQRLTNGATELAGATRIALEPPLGQYVYLVAALVEGEVGVWAVGPWLGGARVMGVDTAARRWSDWGDAISDESAAGKQRRQLASRREVVAVRACATR